MRHLPGWKLVNWRRESATAAREAEDVVADVVPKAVPDVVADDVWIADNCCSRFLGWQFRSAPPTGTGLLLVPCRAIHTCWMRFPLDVVLLDEFGRVVEVRRSVAPWRVVRSRAKVYCVLELPASDRTVPIAEGDQLGLVGPLRPSDVSRFQVSGFRVQVSGFRLSVIHPSTTWKSQAGSLCHGLLSET